LTELGVTSKLELLGPFRLLKGDGTRVEVASKKGQGLIAMLAVSGGGERTRTWLQDKLWGSSPQEQAQASMRTLMSGLRTTLSRAGLALLQSDHARIWLDLAHVSVDARSTEILGERAGEFLEGLDIPGEEGFEDWLRDERSRFADLRARLPAPAPKVQPGSSAKADAGVAFSGLPALAVLPFANLTGDPSKDIMCEGLSEDLIDRLARLRWLPIIARGSSFEFVSGKADSQSIGEQLGARYLLDGRLRDVGGDIIVAVSLTDAHTSQIIWSNKQTLSGASPAALHELLTGFALTMSDKIDLQEQNRVLHTGQTDLNVRGLIWRGRWHLNRFTREDAKAAKAFFAQALEQEPNSPEALIQMANTLLWDAWALRGQDQDVRAVRAMAQKAIIADYDDARGHMIAGIAECFLRQPHRAVALLSRAIDLNPSLFLAHGYLGSTHYLNDDPAAALEPLSFAVRLSPNDQHLFHVLGELAISHYMLGNFEKAIDFSDASTLRRPAYWFAHVIKVNAYRRLGQLDVAKDAYATLLDVSSHFDQHFIDWVPFCDRRWNRELKEGLNQASSSYDLS
jgi:TolB-like protein/Flp pilus assembly protein TadD